MTSFPHATHQEQAHPSISSLRRKRITLKPSAAALDSDEDKQMSQSQHESGTESNDDELNPFSPHISTLNAAGRGFASIKKCLLRTALRGDSHGFDSFVTVPLGPTAKNTSPSVLPTLSNRSGRPSVTTRCNRSFAPHTLTIWDKLLWEHGPSRREPQMQVGRERIHLRLCDEMG